MKNITFKIICFILTALVIEIVLRFFGISPYPHYNPKEIEKLYQLYDNYMCEDDIYGYKPCNDGITKKIPQNNCLIFNVTHVIEGGRYCGKTSISSPKVLILGDSNIHGDGVNDNQHVGFLLQQKLDFFKVINTAIPGSSNLSQLLVLRNYVHEYDDIKIVIAAYASYHDERNIFARSRKKQIPVAQSIINKIRFPSAKLENDSVYIINMEYYKYTPVPLSNYFSIFESINLILEYIESKIRKTELLTELIIKDIILECRKKNIKLHYLILNENKRSEKIKHLLTLHNVSFSQIHFTDDKKLLPCDNHPNFYGHQLMTDSIYQMLEKNNMLEL